MHGETDTDAIAKTLAPPVVALTKINKWFGPNQVLCDVSLTVHSGRSHALLGRNGAGKSTAVSIITGLREPDSGSIEFDGEPAPPASDLAAWRRRVACLYQRSTVVPTLTVAENLYLNQQPVRAGRINWKQMYRDAQTLLDRWEVPVDARTSVSALRVGDRQLVEIARALSSGTRFVILDEPTAKLDGREVQRLFAQMRQMQAAGVTFLYISHHLNEIYEVTQDVTILRDGRHIVTAEVARTPAREVIRHMAGDAAGAPARRSRRARERVVRADNAAPAILRARGVGCTKAAEPFSGVDLEVSGGEIVGIAGLEGSGKLGLAHVLVGMVRAGTGSVTVQGRRLGGGSVQSAIAAGVGFVPEDRQRFGIVATMSLAENATLSALGRFGRAGFLTRRRQAAAAARMVADLGVVTPSIQAPITALSGGNQQKALLGRALATRPRVLVLVHPTAGVDVRSKEALMDVIEDNAQDGVAVVIVSDDLEDLRACDRVLVMFQGRMVLELAAGWRDAQLIAAMEGIDSDDH